MASQASPRVTIAETADASINALLVDLAALQNEVAALRAEVAGLRQDKKTGSELSANQPDTLTILIARCREARYWHTGDWRVGESTVATLLGWHPERIRNARKFGDAPTSFQIGGGNGRSQLLAADLAGSSTGIANPDRIQPDGSVFRLARLWLNSNGSFQPCGAGFAVFARAILLSQGDRLNAVRQAEATPNASPRVTAMLRAAVSAGTTNNPAWAAALSDYQAIESSFVESLRSVGVSTGCWPADQARSFAVRRRREFDGHRRLRDRRKHAEGSVDDEPSRQRPPSAKGRLHRRALGQRREDLIPSRARVHWQRVATRSCRRDRQRILGHAGAGQDAHSATGSDATAVGVDIRHCSRRSPRPPTARSTWSRHLSLKRLAGMTATDGSFAFPDVTPSGGNLAGMPLLVSDRSPTTG